MGFNREEILEVGEPLGNAPTRTQIDDLVQVLLVMGASRATSTDRPADVTTCASSLKPEVDKDEDSASEPGEVEVSTDASDTEDAAFQPADDVPSACASEEFEMAADKVAALRNTLDVSRNRSVVSIEHSMSLQQMGFPCAAIEEAATMLGPAAQFGEIFDMIVARQPHKSAGKQPSSCLPASQHTREVDVARQTRINEVIARVAARLKAESQGKESVVSTQETSDSIQVHEEELHLQEEALLPTDKSTSHAECTLVSAEEWDSSLQPWMKDEAETTSREVAAEIVAAVLINVSKHVVPDETAMQAGKDKLLESGYPASPTRGGA